MAEVVGLVEAVELVLLGSEIVTASPVGATTLYVDSVEDFDDAGGDLDIDGVRYEYVTCDLDTETITLSTPLTVAVAVGDGVHVVTGGQIAVDHIAYVTMGEGDSAEVVLSYADRSLWPLGDYEDPVPVVLSSDLTEIVSVPGRTPVIDGSFIDPETVPVPQTLQDQVNAALTDAGAAASAASQAAADADTAITAAATAQSAADQAQSSADGKNTITYSLSTPGSTPNVAGDTWFRRDGTGVIIAQWEGAGGTTWTPRTLDNAVIATLDAAKLTAGSAFTQTLVVRNTFTLGTASNDGVVESYNYAAASTGVRINKAGLTAKGGSLTGALVQTDAGPTTGIKLTSSGLTAYGAGVPTLAIDAVTGAITMKGNLTSGSTIAGATFQTSTSGERIVIAGDRIETYSGLSGETPGFIDPDDLGSGRGTLWIASGTASPHLDKSSLLLASGNVGTPPLANVVTGTFDVAATANVLFNAENLIDFVAGTDLHILADDTITMAADLIALFGPVTVDPIFTLGATMGAGSVGTGTFRDSVDARAKAQMAAGLRFGEDSVPITATGTRMTKVVTFSPAYPAGVTPIVSLTLMGTTPQNFEGITVSSITNTQFTANVIRKAGSATTAGFQWTAMAAPA